MVLLTLSDAGISLLDIAFLGLLLVVINLYTDPGYIQKMPLHWQSLFKSYPLFPAFLFLVVFGCKNALGYVIFGAQYSFIYQVACRLSTANLQGYLASDYSRYVLTDSSVHIRKINHQPIEFVSHVLRGLQQVISQGLLIAITVAALLLYNPRLFLLLLALLLPVSLLIGRLMKTQLQSIRLHGKQIAEKSIQHLSEALSGFIESNIYHKSDFFLRRYTKDQQRLAQYLTRQQVVQGMPARTIEVLAVAGLVILIVFNRLLTGSNATPVITIGAFMAAAYKIIPGIVNILNNIGMMKTYSFTTDDLPEPDETAHKPIQVPPDKLHSVHFDGVHFGYGADTILQDFNLQVDAGDCVAISGVSGRGKTTIAHLLMGFISPDKGTIVLNYLPTDAPGRKLFWHRISYVQQRPFLINDTVLKNITLEEETQNKARLRMAAKAAGLTGTEGGSLGLKRLIRENGKNISGGQRQRIAFARALYKDFDLLILDEPFSELDPASETGMLEYLQQLSKEGKTILIITHHKANFFYCNKIVSLDGA